MIYGIVLGLHVVICVILVLIVLLQSSKGTGLAGGAFGGGAESTVFGGRSAATVLSKATTIFGAAFMVTSLSLTLLGSVRGSGSPRSIIADEAARQAPLGAPSATAPPGAESASPGTALPGTALPGTASGALPVAPPAGDAGAAPAPAPAEGSPSAPPAGEGTQTP